MHPSPASTVQGVAGFPAGLDTLGRAARELNGVARAEMLPGDRLLVHTRNSVYSILALGRDRYAVSGGWFTRNGCAPAVLGILGCTFGGRAILTRMLAAPGLCLEFENALTTSRIRTVYLVRGDDAWN